MCAVSEREYASQSFGRMLSDTARTEKLVSLPPNESFCELSASSIA